MRNLFVGLMLSILLHSVLFANDSSDQFDDLKVLFIGNSLTAYNDMPEMFKQLAAVSGRNVRVGKAFHQGKALFELRYNDDVEDSIYAEQWDYVVLQSSDLYAFEDYYDLEKNTIEVFRRNILRNNENTKIIYPMIWAAMNGYRFQIDGETYEATHEEHYDMIYETIFPFMYDNEPLIVAPVAVAWNELIQENVEIKQKLYDPDRVHPARDGSYVMASVMFYTIYYDQQNTYDSFEGINPDTAYHYQEVARAAVRSNHSLWNINYDYTSIAENDMGKSLFKLFKPAPNPMADKTNIKFEVYQPANVKIQLLDIHGRLVREITNEEYDKGLNEVVIYREALPNGIYFIRMDCQNYTEIQKLIVQ